jgi:hypothetical protein
MNQQIKLLAQEAGMYVDVKGEPWPRWMGAEECEAAYEKFAQLIVRECMNVLDPGEHQLIARFHARQWLAEHFGVEQ